MPNSRHHYRRHISRRNSAKSSRAGKSFYENPRLDPRLKKLFRKIGVPGAAPFKPDPFQIEALERLKDYDVLVSAPTGAGKTWIATQAISYYLSEELKTWYASPLKALSNSIYQQFCQEFGAENCGILTGDRKENPKAPIIVGTTEILRNQLYDAMHEGVSIQTDLVILDEAHYLSDPDRGVVWEEVLIYLPSRVKLLLLSATISNAEEIASWLEENRGKKTYVVRSTERPVPLEMLFLFPDGLISPLAGKKGLVPGVRKFISSSPGRGRRRGPRQLHYGEIIKCLRAFDLLPAIFFLKSRADCDRALLSCHETERPAEVRERFKKEVRDFIKRYPHLEGHRQMKYLMKCMVGSHHAGQLPYWKMLIEKMMVKGYLDAIFSTSTVAAGVNFPARTVVLVQSDRYDGREFSNLTATELHQMTGRAGRRGKDNIGFALVVPGFYQDPQLIFELADSPPEPLVSQIHINFSMTLNLLLSHTPEMVKDLLNRSFASFLERKQGSKTEAQWEEAVGALQKIIPNAKCDSSDPYEIIENIQKRSELKKKALRRAGRVWRQKLIDSYRKYLEPGRLFLHQNNNVYVVFESTLEEDGYVCLALDLRKKVRLRKGHIRLKKVELTKIKGIFDLVIELPADVSPESLESLFSSVSINELQLVRVGISEEPQGIYGYDQEDRSRRLPCEECEHLRICHGGRRSEFRSQLRKLVSLAKEMEEGGGGLWISFKRHLRFLKDTGFVDDKNELTHDGIWASKLRLDYPLLIAEAIRKGGFDGVSPEIMAGCLAPFVWDRVQELDREIYSPLSLEELEKAFERILKSIENIRALKERRGFENPEILFWPAAALFLWAKGLPWDQLVSTIPIDEGDMASLVVRTADHLRQVANLSDTHPELASTAEKAIALIMREPVLIE